MTRPSTPTTRLLTLAVGWAASRALMLWLLVHDDIPLLGGGGVAREVQRLYFRWYGVLTQGTFPADDRLWQYPPGAGPVLLSPALLPTLTYFEAFVALTLAADVLILLALTRAGSRPAVPCAAPCTGRPACRCSSRCRSRATTCRSRRSPSSPC